MIMTKKELVGYALAILVGVALITKACVGVNSETGEREFITIEQMSDQQFDSFKLMISSLTRLTCRPILETKPEMAGLVQIVIENGRALTSSGEAVSLTGLVAKLTENVDNPDVQDFVLAAIAVVELNGGFPLQDEVSQVLTERGVDVLGAVLDGMESVLPAEVK